MTRHRVITVCALLTPLFAAGCASKPPRPDAQLARAEASISQAEQAGARQHSGAEYDAARDKLSEARRLADKGETGTAALLADQARADADLAAAHARHVTADKAAAEVRVGTETLQEEAARRSGAASPSPVTR